MAAARSAASAATLLAWHLDSKQREVVRNWFLHGIGLRRGASGTSLAALLQGRGLTQRRLCLGERKWEGVWL
jgi:hypothetical protein